MREKMKKYNFWTSLAGSVVILICAIGKFCGFEIENEIISNVIIAFAGVLVVFGVVVPDEKHNSQEDLKNENITQNDENSQKKQ